MLAPMTATHGIPDRALFDRTQAAIDARETARAEALLQVCKLVPTQDYRDTDLIKFISAIQHDMIEDDRRRIHTVSDALGLLALEWHVLPVDAREVIVAGLLPDHTREIWARFRSIVVVGIAGNYTAYQECKRALVGAILGMEIPTDV
jgi:hypothetical protein